MDTKANGAVSEEALIADLKAAMKNLAEHKYWMIRVSGGDGKVRVEQTFSDSPYILQGIVVDRK